MSTINDVFSDEPYPRRRGNGNGNGSLGERDWEGGVDGRQEQGRAHLQVGTGAITIHEHQDFSIGGNHLATRFDRSSTFGSAAAAAAAATTTTTGVGESSPKRRPSSNNNPSTRSRSGRRDRQSNRNTGTATTPTTTHRKSSTSEPDTSETTPLSPSSPNQSFTFELNLPPEADVSPLSCRESVIAMMMAKSANRTLESPFAEIHTSPKRSRHDRSRKRTNGPTKGKGSETSRKPREGRRRGPVESDNDGRSRRGSLKKNRSADDRQRRKRSKSMSKDAGVDDKQRRAHRSRSLDVAEQEAPRRRNRSRSGERDADDDYEYDDGRRRRRHRSRSRAPADSQIDAKSPRPRSKMAVSETGKNQARGPPSRRGGGSQRRSRSTSPSQTYAHADTRAEPRPIGSKARSRSWTQIDLVSPSNSGKNTSRGGQKRSRSFAIDGSPRLGRTGSAPVIQPGELSPHRKNLNVGLKEGGSQNSTTKWAIVKGDAAEREEAHPSPFRSILDGVKARISTSSSNEGSNLLAGAGPDISPKLLLGKEKEKKLSHRSCQLDSHGSVDDNKNNDGGGGGGCYSKTERTALRDRNALVKPTESEPKSKRLNRNSRSHSPTGRRTRGNSSDIAENPRRIRSYDGLTATGPKPSDTHLSNAISSRAVGGMQPKSYGSPEEPDTISAHKKSPNGGTNGKRRRTSSSERHGSIESSRIVSRPVVAGKSTNAEDDDGVAGSPRMRKNGEAVSSEQSVPNTSWGASTGAFQENLQGGVTMRQHKLSSITHEDTHRGGRSNSKTAVGNNRRVSKWAALRWSLAFISEAKKRVGESRSRRGSASPSVGECEPYKGNDFLQMAPAELALFESDSALLKSNEARAALVYSNPVDASVSVVQAMIEDKKRRAVESRKRREAMTTNAGIGTSSPRDERSVFSADHVYASRGVTSAAPLTAHQSAESRHAFIQEAKRRADELSRDHDGTTRSRTGSVSSLSWDEKGRNTQSEGVDTEEVEHTPGGSTKRKKREKDHSKSGRQTVVVDLIGGSGHSSTPDQSASERNETEGIGKRPSNAEPSLPPKQAKGKDRSLHGESDERRSRAHMGSNHKAKGKTIRQQTHPKREVDAAGPKASDSSHRARQNVLKKNDFDSPVRSNRRQEDGRDGVGVGVGVKKIPRNRKVPEDGYVSHHGSTQSYNPGPIDGGTESSDWMPPSDEKVMPSAKPSRWVGLRKGVEFVNKPKKKAEFVPQATAIDSSNRTALSSEGSKPRSMWVGLRNNIRHEMEDNENAMIAAGLGAGEKKNRRSSTWKSLRRGMEFISRSKRNKAG